MWQRGLGAVPHLCGGHVTLEVLSYAPQCSLGHGHRHTRQRSDDAGGSRGSCSNSRDVCASAYKACVRSKGDERIRAFEVLTDATELQMESTMTRIRLAH